MQIKYEPIENEAGAASNLFLLKMLRFWAAPCYFHAIETCLALNIHIYLYTYVNDSIILYYWFAFAKLFFLFFSPSSRLSRFPFPQK